MSEGQKTRAPQVIDLYSGRGGVGLALDELGLTHVGVDVVDYSDTYPGEFIQADASDLEFIKSLPSPDILWMSPPCQAYSTLSHCNKHRLGFEDPRDHYPTFSDLNVRDVVDALAPGDYIIENVPTCEDLEDPTRLNGLGFGLGFDNERHFETSFPVPNQLGTGEATISMNTRQESSQRVGPLAEAKRVPASWGRQGVRSAIPREYVAYLLHYCPSAPDIDLPDGVERQSFLTEMVA